MSTCLPPSKVGNVGLAFGIVTAAGMSTALGAGLAFVMPKNKGTTNLFLAGSLGIAAGVMLFVSFVEIFADKAVSAFADCLSPDKRESYGYLYATLCFFGGVLLTYLFELALHAFERWLLARRSPTAAHDLEDVDAQSSSIAESPRSSTNIVANENLSIDHDVGHDGEMVAEIYRMTEDDTRALTRMGIFAGLALAFHNFPEGLATFVAVMDDPRVGASVAVAIAIHNIPEGICVAMPIYYATGSKWKGFLWATLSGVTELVGALLGYLVLRKVLSQTVYGILFGIVAGMMVFISLKQLLPTAHKYDPNDRVTTASLCLGMTIMSLSLVLFKF